MQLSTPSQVLANQRLSAEFLDDFFQLDAGLWDATVVDAAGTVALDTDGVGGLIILTTETNDNDEAYLFTKTEGWNFLASRPIDVTWQIQYAEANTDDANVIVGLMSGVAADALQDDGAGPAASYTGAVFFKADGNTLWSVETSNGATQTTTQTDVTAGGATAQVLSIQCVPTSSTNVDVTFWIDGVQCRDADGDLIRHSVSITSASEMSLVVGIKNGGANVETLTTDYVGATIRR